MSVFRKCRIRKLREKNKRYREYVRLFRERNVTQADADFAGRCFNSPNNAETVIALAVRRAIARFGRISPDYIRAEITFFELEGLPRWGERCDVFFDYTHFIKILELELKRKISDKEAESLPDVENGLKLTVREFVLAVFRKLGTVPE